MDKMPLNDIERRRQARELANRVINSALRADGPRFRFPVGVINLDVANDVVAICARHKLRAHWDYEGGLITFVVLS